MLALALLALPAFAEPVWPELAATIFDARPLREAGPAIRLDIPYRTEDDARTRIAATIAPSGGRLIERVTVVLDENPAPVAPVIALTRPQPRLHFDVTLRINGPTPVHVVAETTDGALWVAEGHVKTSGQGACAAPPGTDPEQALATLGQMALSLARLDHLDALLSGSDASRLLGVEISHPSHSGMQMDQISLLFIPMRHVQTVEIGLDGGGYATVTGGISLSENPRLRLSIPDDAQSAQVRMTDTDGATSEAEMELPAY